MRTPTNHRNAVSPWVRTALALAVFAVLAAQPVAAAAQQSLPAPVMGEDGLHKQPWFKKSDLDLRKDLADANRRGRILSLMFEQKGCSYCRRMHTENFAYREIVDYMTAHFETVQLDLRGQRLVTQIDGTPIEESKLARKYRVNGTPNVVFLGPDGETVFRMPGYAEPALFLAVYQYVKEKGYEQASIQEWIKSR